MAPSKGLNDALGAVGGEPLLCRFPFHVFPSTILNRVILLIINDHLVHNSDHDLAEISHSACVRYRRSPCFHDGSPTHQTVQNEKVR